MIRAGYGYFHRREVAVYLVWLARLAETMPNAPAGTVLARMPIPRFVIDRACCVREVPLSGHARHQFRCLPFRDQ
jgi:hypothetical protein